MKKTTALFFLLLLFSTTKSLASHILGTEISYHQVAINMYQVTMKMYRDCSSSQATTSVSVQVQAPGCNIGRGIVLGQVSKQISKPYGPAIPVVCNATSRPNVEIVTYAGMLTFSAAEAVCSDWILYWLDCCRNNTANLLGQSDLYTETKLKLATGLVNSSPVFDTLQAPVMLVNVGNRYNLSMAAIDPDGDSLVYSLVNPLESANTPAAYKPFPPVNTTPGMPAGMFINPYPQLPFSNPGNPQFAQFTGGQATAYSAALPLPSLSVNWFGPPTVNYGPPFGMIWEARQLFSLNPVNGELTFTPSRFVPNGTYSDNRYVVAIMVEEYRKVNGIMTRLGSIRKETIIDVSDDINRNPEVINQQANNQHIPAGYEIKLRPGTPLILNFAGTEPDQSQSVSITTNASYILPGSTFTSTSGNSATGTITWTPTAAHARWQPYFFHVLLRDDSNPLRGFWVETFSVRVSNTGGVTGAPEGFETGSFAAYPNPFSEELNFKLNLQTKAESILIYNLLGQQLDEILLKDTASGEQNVKWVNAKDHAAGTYVARLFAKGRSVQTLKFIKLK